MVILCMWIIFVICTYVYNKDEYVNKCMRKFSWNNCRTPGNIQSNVWGDISLKAEDGIIAGCWVREGVTSKPWHMLPRESRSTVTLISPRRWEAVMQMSKCATKNDKERSRCITNLSLLEPILMAMTRLGIVTLKTYVVLRQKSSPDSACKYNWYKFLSHYPNLILFWWPLSL